MVQGTDGASLSSTIHAVQVQWGPLALVQLQDLIRGWTVGSEDAPSYAQDLATGLGSNPAPF